MPLPGIGRKTANVVLGHAYDVNEGIAVDTHVLRVANRLGLVEGDDPLKVEAAADGPRPPRAVDPDHRPHHLPRPEGLRRAPAGLRRLPAVRGVCLGERQAWAQGQPPPGAPAGATLDRGARRPRPKPTARPRRRKP